MEKKHYWFKAKLFGWGWYPASKEGWLVTLGFLILLFGLTHLSLHYATQPSEYYLFFVPGVLILSSVLVAICFRTGEKPRWRWGK